MTFDKHLLARLALGLLAFAIMPAHASGPRVICGTGAPIKFPGAGSVTLNYDLGALGSRSKAQADAIVTNAISLWTNVGTASIVLSRGPDMPEDVTTANLATYYPNNAANTADGLNPVVYDTDGSILDAIFGAGAKNNLLGFATTRFANCLFQEGTVFISGFKAVTDTTMGVVFAHEVGHMVGMDHTQLDNSQGIASTASYPLMYPVANRGSVTLHEDDIAGISLLYPDPMLNSVYGQITGNFVLADGITPVKGANLWATETTTGKVYSVVSDYLKQNTGFFRILLPAGTYTLRAEAVQTAYVGASSVGPYALALTDPSFQPPMYPSGSGGAPMAPVTLGNATPVTFTIAPACTASVIFGIDGSGTVGGNCPSFPGTLQFTAAAAGTPELWRMTISPLSRFVEGRVPPRSFIMLSIAAVPRRSFGWRMVVRGTRKYSLTKMFPNPATEICPGILMPWFSNTSAAPMATRSFVAWMAVACGFSFSICSAAFSPSSMVLPALKTSLSSSSSPASRMARR